MSYKKVLQEWITKVSYKCFAKVSHKNTRRNISTRLPRNSHIKREGFARNFLQNSSGNIHWNTYIKQSCQAISRFQPLKTRPANTPIPMSPRHSLLPQSTSLQSPASATKPAGSSSLPLPETKKKGKRKKKEEKTEQKKKELKRRRDRARERGRTRERERRHAL